MGVMMMMAVMTVSGASPSLASRATSQGGSLRPECVSPAEGWLRSVPGTHCASGKGGGRGRRSPAGPLLHKLRRQRACRGIACFIIYSFILYYIFIFVYLFIFSQFGVLCWFGYRYFTVVLYGKCHQYAIVYFAANYHWYFLIYTSLVSIVCTCLSSSALMTANHSQHIITQSGVNL